MAKPPEQGEVKCNRAGVCYAGLSATFWRFVCPFTDKRVDVQLIRREYVIMMYYDYGNVWDTRTASNWATVLNIAINWVVQPQGEVKK